MIRFAVVLFLLGVQHILLAGEASTHTYLCGGSLGFIEILECVQNHSPELRLAKNEIQFLMGRKKIASYRMPSNPTIQGSQSMRRGNAGVNIFEVSPITTPNGEILISQEIWIGGQRQIREQVADLDFQSAVRNMDKWNNITQFDAFSSTVLYLGALEEQSLNQKLYELSHEIFKISKARTDRGLGAPIETDLAESESLRNFQNLQISSRNLLAKKADLLVMMGVPFDTPLELKESYPLWKSDILDYKKAIEYALNHRPEVESALLRIHSREKSIELIRRERIPNLTISGFVQRDGFNENVVGGRVSMPLRVWRDFSGEIDEAKALQKKEEAFSEIQSHAIQREVLQSLSSYKSLLIENQEYPKDIPQKVDDNLDRIRQALQNGQMNIRDALIYQSSLVQLKSNYLQSKINLSLSQIRLAWALGYDLRQTFSLESQKRDTP